MNNSHSSHDLERAALVALLRRGDRSWWQYAQLVELRGSALAVLAGDFDDPWAEDVGEMQLFADERVKDDEVDLEPIVGEIGGWEADGSRLLTVLDDEYPSNLRSIHDRPPFLFVRGALLPSDRRSVAVVGSRKASEQGIEKAAQIATSAGEAGYTVVSGLAKGIDSSAHRSTLESGARTVAVIGTGIRNHYPPGNEELQDEIATRCAVISQFWPDATPTKKSFPMRNAVMSGFALATIVVEASGHSGARMQARLALEHGRPVFLLRPLLVHDWAQDYSSRPGTHVVDDFDEVFGTLAELEVQALEFA